MVTFTGWKRQDTTGGDIRAYRTTLIQGRLDAVARAAAPQCCRRYLADDPLRG
jgi:hypothetical protein